MFDSCKCNQNQMSCLRMQASLKALSIRIKEAIRLRAVTMSYLRFAHLTERDKKFCHGSVDLGHKEYYINLMIVA